MGANYGSGGGRRLLARATVCLLVGGLLAGCSGGSGEASAAFGDGSEPAPPYAVGVLVVDEDGLPVSGATWRVEGLQVGGARAVWGTSDPAGRFQIEDLHDAELIMVEAFDFLREPLVVDRSDAGTLVTLPLLRSRGPGGRRRVAMHFAGDAMLARRYIEPALDFTALVTPGDGGRSAREVVRAIAPLFRAAHVRSLNLETVVGDLPPSGAYPAKRFLLQSPPETTHLLDELGASCVTLGNNHARDWLDDGVRSTLRTLDGALIRHVGGGASEEEAARHFIIEEEGYSLGFLSYTSVDGDFVNDNLPDDFAAVPPDLSPGDAWQYEFRIFGYDGPTVRIEERARRVGGLWRELETVLPSVGAAEELADLWARASDVYPELQDWTARRGHGGANAHSPEKLEADVTGLREAGCDLIIVALHAGFQFLEAKSTFVEQTAHEAIDAGADLVVCHHPHVLQGFQWYEGKLVAHSLGNFVFDQDFLVTFPSAILRVVFEETSILEARVLPVVIDRYRPAALGGEGAQHVLRTIRERSVLPFSSERSGGVVRNVRRDPPLGAAPPRFVLERHSAQLLQGAPSVERATIRTEAGAIVNVAPTYLLRSRGPGGAPLEGIRFARDLLGWGSFEDHAADGESRGGTHWVLDSPWKRIDVRDDLPSGVRCLRLERDERNRSRVLARTVARVPIARHRLHEEVAGGFAPADGEPSYSLRLRARLSGFGTALVRIGVYHFDDSDPTSDPISVPLRTVEEPIYVSRDGAWHEVIQEISPTILAPSGGLDASALLIYIGLAPPTSGSSTLFVDDLQVLEWRSASDLPDGWYGVDALDAAGVGPGEIEIERTME